MAVMEAVGKLPPNMASARLMFTDGTDLSMDTVVWIDGKPFAAGVNCGYSSNPDGSGGRLTEYRIPCRQENHISVFAVSRLFDLSIRLKTLGQSRLAGSKYLFSIKIFS